jgi:hypothetical protein
MRELLHLYYPAQALKPEHLATNQAVGFIAAILISRTSLTHDKSLVYGPIWFL